MGDDTPPTEPDDESQEPDDEPAEVDPLAPAHGVTEDDGAPEPNEPA